MLFNGFSQTRDACGSGKTASHTSSLADLLDRFGGIVAVHFDWTYHEVRTQYAIMETFFPASGGTVVSAEPSPERLNELSIVAFQAFDSSNQGYFSSF